MLNFQGNHVKAMIVLAAAGMGGALCAEESGTAVDFHNRFGDIITVHWDKEKEQDPFFKGLNIDHMRKNSFGNDRLLSRHFREFGILLAPNQWAAFSFDFLPMPLNPMRASWVMPFKVKVKGVAHEWHFQYIAKRYVTAEGEAACKAEIREVDAKGQALESKAESSIKRVAPGAGARADGNEAVHFHGGAWAGEGSAEVKSMSTESKRTQAGVPARAAVAAAPAAATVAVPAAAPVAASVAAPAAAPVAVPASAPVAVPAAPAVAVSAAAPASSAVGTTSAAPAVAQAASAASAVAAKASVRFGLGARPSVRFADGAGASARSEAATRAYVRLAGAGASRQAAGASRRFPGTQAGATGSLAQLRASMAPLSGIPGGAPTERSQHDKPASEDASPVSVDFSTAQWDTGATLVFDQTLPMIKAMEHLKISHKDDGGEVTIHEVGRKFGCDLAGSSTYVFTFDFLGFPLAGMDIVCSMPFRVESKDGGTRQHCVLVAKRAFDATEGRMRDSAEIVAIPAAREESKRGAGRAGEAGPEFPKSPGTSH